MSVAFFYTEVVPCPMGELFLSARTEIVRGLDIDTGRTMLIIGAPKWFLDWMDRFIPESTVIEEAGGKDGPVGTFDIVLLWCTDVEGLSGEIDRAKARIRKEGDLWAVVDGKALSDIELHPSGNDRKKVAVIPLTIKLNIVPVFHKDDG